MLERLIEEVRRRERVIRIFPNSASALRLIGARLQEQHEEWLTGRRYFDMSAYFEWRQHQKQRDEPEKPTELPKQLENYPCIAEDFYSKNWT